MISGNCSCKRGEHGGGAMDCSDSNPTSRPSQPAAFRSSRLFGTAPSKPGLADDTPRPSADLPILKLARVGRQRKMPKKRKKKACQQEEFESGATPTLTHGAPEKQQGKKNKKKKKKKKKICSLVDWRDERGCHRSAHHTTLLTDPLGPSALSTAGCDRWQVDCASPTSTLLLVLSPLTLCTPAQSTFFSTTSALALARHDTTSAPSSFRFSLFYPTATPLRFFLSFFPHHPFILPPLPPVHLS